MLWDDEVACVQYLVAGCVSEISQPGDPAIEDRHQIDDIAQVRIYSIKDTYNGTSSFTYWFGINNALSRFSYLRIDEGPYKGDYYETR